MFACGGSAVVPGFSTTGEWHYSSLPAWAPGKASLWTSDRDGSACWNPQLQSLGKVRGWFC